MKIIASRYASALFELAQEEKKEALFRDQIKFVLQSLEAHPELLNLMNKTQVSKDEKRKLLDQLYAPYVDAYILQIMKLTVDKQRQRILPYVFRAYLRLHNEHFNIIEAIAYSVDPLTPDEILALEQDLSEKEQQTVTISNRLDKSLVSGIKLSYGDKIIDGSMKGRLEQLRTTLLKERS
jgi:F-type H+-transporting ATPase subunit delta